MYKIFHGFALVEAYQNLKKAKRLAENKSVSRFVKLAIAIVVSLVLLLYLLYYGVCLSKSSGWRG